MEHENLFEITVPENQRKQRLDKYLTSQISSVSRARLQKVIAAELVLVNGKAARASHLISPQEKIQVCIPKPVKVDILSEDIPLDIVYEDDDLLLVNKKAGMVVHPAFGNYTGTLVNALMHHCGHLSSVGGRQRPGIVHRLDKDTSGLIIIAKTDLAHAHLSRQFAAKTTQREYHAIVWGKFKKKSGKIETYLARSPKDRKRITVQKQGKLAVTNYHVLESFWLHSLVQLNLETGRTHQIRVHLSYFGHPVFGDPTYAGRNRQLGALSVRERGFCAELLSLIDRQALHAKSLGFVHPRTEEFMTFDSQLPYDMKQLLERIRSEKA